MFQRTRRRFFSAAAVAALVGSGIGAAPAVSRGEDVGMSSERLTRIHPMIQSHIDGYDFSGAVTLVARKGKVGAFILFLEREAGCLLQQGCWECCSCMGFVTLQVEIVAFLRSEV
jgi:hypothetical protein